MEPSAKSALPATRVRPPNRRRFPHASRDQDVDRSLLANGRSDAHDTSPADRATLDGFLALIADPARPDLAGPLKLATLIGRLVARATSDAQASSAANLAASDIDILAALASRGEPFRAKPSELAAWANVSGAAITGRVDRLELRGLVGRSIDPADRRVRWITLTAAGVALLREQTRGMTERPLFVAIQRMSRRERTTLARLLRQLI